MIWGSSMTIQQAQETSLENGWDICMSFENVEESDYGLDLEMLTIPY